MFNENRTGLERGMGLNLRHRNYLFDILIIECD